MSDTPPVDPVQVHIDRYAQTKRRREAVPLIVALCVCALLLGGIGSWYAAGRFEASRMGPPVIVQPAPELPHGSITISEQDIGHSKTTDTATNKGMVLGGIGDAAALRGINLAPGSVSGNGISASGGGGTGDLSAKLKDPETLTILASIAGCAFAYFGRKKQVATPDDVIHWGACYAAAVGCFIAAANNALFYWAGGIALVVFVVAHLFPSASGIAGVLAQSALGRVGLLLQNHPETNTAILAKTETAHDIAMAQAVAKASK